MVQVADVVHVEDARGAALALAFDPRAQVPHVLVGDELVAAVEDVQERYRPVLADQGGRGVDLGHR